MNFTTSKNHRGQRGLSLIEVLIAMVMGLLVISAVFNTYMGSARSALFSEGVARMQENGRYGITTMQRGIRLAGFSPDGDLEPFDIANSSSSSIVIRVTDLYDCNGESTAAENGIAINTYAHDEVNGTITCTGNIVGDAMPVVEGVDAMRLLWGIDADDDNVPDHYVVYNSSIDANTVIAMRVALLVNSGEPIRSRSSEETHVLLDQVITSPNDKVVRDVFSSTVMLRNID